MIKPTFSQGLKRLGAKFLGGAILAGALVVLSSSLALAATLPASTCTLVGSTRTCDLYAETGTMPASSLPGGPAAGVPVYGYSLTNTAVTAPGGPTLIANQGETLVINLHNVNMPSATSLMISQLAGIPDTTGVTAGNVTTYTFPPASLLPGTYLYEAGLTADGPRQVAMGLFGALVVRPVGAPNQAYASPATAFNDEAVLVLSEIDPDFNANPEGFNMAEFAPKFWLINGQVYTSGAPTIGVSAGDSVLLRYVNAGLKHHSMSLAGLHQVVLARDGKPLTNPQGLVADTVPTGGSMDTLVTIPATAPAGSQFPVYEAAMHLDNNGVRSTTAAASPISYGGMLTFLQVGGSSTSNGGPVTSGVSLSPNPSNGTAPVTLTATITPSTGATVSAAEYFVDSLGANGAGCQITGSLTAVSVTIPLSGATAPCVDLTTLASGNHTFYVHGQDTSGTPGPTWGVVSSAVLNLDKAGPVVSSMSLTPNPTNGLSNVTLLAMASDVTTGNHKVVAAEYFVDPVGAPAPGTGTAFTIATPANIVSLNSTLLAATIASLPEGSHTVAVRGEDELGNWGGFGTIALKVDKTGPGTSGVTAAPNPNNGSQGEQVGSGGAFYVRVDATVSDPVSGSINSPIVAAEYFIDTDPGAGKGGGMLALDGVFSGPTEKVFAAIDLIHISALAQGNHTLYVRGQDAAGNWGPTTSTTLVIDKTAPAITALSTTPFPAKLANTITLSVTAADPVAGGVNTNIVAGEYFWGSTDPGIGLGTPFTFGSPAPTLTNAYAATIDVSQRTVFNNNNLTVRVKDAAGNWSKTFVVATGVDRIFANSFPASAAPYGWSATGGNAARLSLSASANMGVPGTDALAVNVTGGTSGYVVDTLLAGQTSYDARFYVNPNNAILGNATPTIFAAMNGGTVVFRVELRKSGVNYQVRVVGNTNSAWYTISGPTAIEVARVGTSLTLYVGSSAVPVQTVTVGTALINAARLGFSAGVTNAMNGTTIYLDSFVSSRTTHVGP